MTHRRAWFWRTWSVSILIFIGGSVPSGRLDDLVRWQSWLGRIFSDRMLHFGGFGLFALALGFDYMAMGWMRIPYARIVLRAGALGLALEIWQVALPSRAFELGDLGFDLLGCLAGLLLLGFLRRLRR